MCLPVASGLKLIPTPHCSNRYLEIIQGTRVGGSYSPSSDKYCTAVPGNCVDILHIYPTNRQIEVPAQLSSTMTSLEGL